VGNGKKKQKNKKKIEKTTLLSPAF
jgi:hypothetical protein